MHWDTRRPVLLKACAKHGARDFSEKYMLRLIMKETARQESSIVDPKNSLAYFGAIQGHSGGIPIDPELMGVFSNSLHLDIVYF